MPLSSADVETLRVTASAKFKSELSQASDQTYKKFTIQETFGSEGFAPVMMSGIGPAHEWTSVPRVLHQMEERGVRYTGKVRANGVTRKNTDVADAIVATASAVATELARDTLQDNQTQAMRVLLENHSGFDYAPLFGDHTHNVSGRTFTNVVPGNKQPAFLLNERALIEATRRGEDSEFGVIGGDQSTETGFMEDAVKMGWRKRKIFAPAFWANSVRIDAGVTPESVRAAIALQAKFRNDKNKRIAAAPKYLVVGLENAAAAEKLLKAQLINGGETNTDYGRLELLVMPDIDTILEDIAIEEAAEADAGGGE